MDTASTTDTPSVDQDVTPPVVAPAPATPPRRTGGWGGLIAAILIVGLIITAAFYTWGERLASQPVPTEEGAP